MDNNQSTIPTPQPDNQSHSAPLINSASAASQPTTKHKLPIWAKVLIGLGCFVVVTIILCVVILSVISINSKKYECTSSQGDITIMYDDDTIKGYLANGMEYDLDTQQTYAKSIGIEQYLDEFNDWFEANTDGTCIKK